MGVRSERGRGAARRACRQLPGQVVRVLDARVHAKAAGRREAVRRVPGQEHAPVLPPRARRGVSSDCRRSACPAAVQPRHRQTDGVDMKEYGRMQTILSAWCGVIS